MSAPARKRPWGLYALWGFAIAAAFCWTLYWFALKNEAVRQAVAWFSAQRAQGADAAYARVSASGYPLRLSLTFEDAHYAPAGGGWRISSPKAALHVNPTDFSLFIVEPRAPVTWETREAARVFTPKESAVSLRLKNRAIERIVAEGEGVAVTRGGAAEMTIGSFVAGLRADPRALGDGQLTLDAQAIALAAPVQGLEGFGRDVRALNVRAVIERGAAFLTAPGDGYAAWRAEGGAARVEGLHAAWGPAEFTAQGRLAMDARNRLAGALDLDLAKPAETYAALAQAGAPVLRGAPAKARLTIRDGAIAFAAAPP
ncbi:MAG: DUF2125 domain-containing protein [Hyphomonadaceae bacterium]